MDKEVMPTATPESTLSTEEREQNAIDSLREQISQNTGQEKVGESTQATTSEKMGQNTFQAAKDYIAAEKQRKAAEALDPRTADVRKAQAAAEKVRGSHEFEQIQQRKRQAEANMAQYSESHPRRAQFEALRDAAIQRETEYLDEKEKEVDKQQAEQIDILYRLANGERMPQYSTPYTQEDGEQFVKTYDECLEKQKEAIESHERIIEALEIEPDDSDEVIDTKCAAIEMAEKAIQEIEEKTKIRALRVFEARKRVSEIKAKRVKPSAKDASPQSAVAGNQMPDNVID